MVIKQAGFCIFNQKGVKFLRFWDHDVKNNMNGVITVIIDWVEKEEHRTGVKA